MTRNGAGNVTGTVFTGAPDVLGPPDIFNSKVVVGKGNLTPDDEIVSSKIDDLIGIEVPLGNNNPIIFGDRLFQSNGCNIIDSLHI